MFINEAFEILHEYYGSHSAAARALSFNISYYRDLRNGRSKPPQRTEQFVLLKAKEASAAMATTAPTNMHAADME